MLILADLTPTFATSTNEAVVDVKTVTNSDDMITQISAMQALAGAQLPLGHG